jgi:c-src tyrosine kinase
LRLLRGRNNGTFLIRNSTNFPDGYTLCVAFNGKVEHYRIYLTTNNQYTCDNDEFFPDLIQLVSHYKRDADGLCHRLVTPQVSESFRQQCESANKEDQFREFERAGVLVPRTEIQLGDVIGRGEFGDVLVANYRGRKVAVKTLKNGLSSELLNEAKIMM